MLKIINRILFFSKIIILLIDFVLTLYILLMLNSYAENELMNLILVCLPLLLTLIVFVISFFFNKGNDHTLFNVASTLALIVILIIDIRTIFDQNMVMWTKGNLNFYYFRNQTRVIKILCYTIFINNLLVIFNKQTEK